MQLLNRRKYERFDVAPMYTAVAVRLLPSGEGILEGHVYDLSEGGAKFELDEPLEPGAKVLMQITLPGGDGESGGRSIFVFAEVVWDGWDEDEPGPVRMAAAFTRFGGAEDRDRLLRFLSGRRVRRAA